MLDPDVVLASVVVALKSIEELVTELVSPDAITGHFFAFGQENSLAKAVGEMTAGTILVAYMDLLGGNFNGEQVWKHRLEVYIRPNNYAVNPSSTATAPHLWWLMMNKPTTVPPGPNIRYVELAGGDLLLMETPTLKYRQDELLQDLFIGQMVFPEKGDV